MEQEKQVLARREALIGGAALLAFAAAPAGAAPAGAVDFDFLHGKWNVAHRKLRKRLAGSNDWFSFPGTLEVDPILGGLGNFDRNRLEDPGGGYEAHSLRLFDPRTGRWSIWWLDSRLPDLDPPVVGRFAGGRGSFYADDSFEGAPIRVRTTYAALGPDAAQWTQAFSPDSGASWEVNWVMDFARVAA